jgi:hypothetical protein
MNADFFTELGFLKKFRSSETFLVKNIITEIKTIMRTHQDRYPDIKINTVSLVFDDICQFASSYLRMVRHMVYPENQYNA